MLLGVALVSSRASALDEWTGTDTAWEVAYLAAHAVDWGQSRDLARRNANAMEGGRQIRPLYNESNPILGRRPSRETVDVYFLSSALVHVGVARVLPSGLRRAFQCSTFGVQVLVAHRNAQMNLSVRF